MKKNYRDMYWSLPVLFGILVAFSYWFALQQLAAISSNAFSSFPKLYFNMTILKCFCTLLAFFLISQFILSYLTKNKITTFAIALTYSPLLLVYTNYSLLFIFNAILILQVCLLLFTLRKKEYSWLNSTYSTDVIALLLLFALHYFISTQFSPSHISMAMFTNFGAVGEEIPVQAPIYKSFSLAKQFVFSNMDYSDWAGVMHPPITLNSTFLQLLTLIFDLPSVSPTAYHQVLSVIYFMLIVAGSFGFYLYFKYALKISTVFAFFGGCLLFFSNTPLIENMLGSDGNVFLSCYALFPFPLLLISLAFNKNSYLLACWAGAAIASQFFFLTPHPEGIIYSCLFFGIYTFGLILFTSTLSWKKRCLLAITSYVSYFILSAYMVYPILLDQLSGNMHTYAHTGDLDINNFQYLTKYLILFAITAPLSLLILWRQKKLSACYLSALLLALSLLLLFKLTTYLAFVTFVVKTLHLGIHIWVPWRIGLFLCLAIFIVSVSCLEAIAQICFTLFCKKFPGFKGKIS